MSFYFEKRFVMTKFLVTGAKGFIASHLAYELRKVSSEIFLISREHGDVSNRSTWKDLPCSDVVYHLAGKTFVPDSWSETSEFVRVNLLGTVEALNYSLRCSAHLIFVSAYVYGIPDKLPIDENHPVKPNNPYALSKHLAEQACEFYALYRGVKVTILRPFNVFGPGQNATFLIPKIIKQVTEGNSISIHDLNPKRDFLYIDDLIQALIQATSLTGQFEVINIGSGTSYSVKEIIEIIQQKAETRLPIYLDSFVRPNEIPDVRADISKAKHVMDWEPIHSFQNGIEMLINGANGPSS